MLVKYYSADDMLMSYHLSLMEDIIHEHDEGKRPKTINDVVALFNCIRLIESEVYLKTWDDLYIDHCKMIKNEFITIVGQEFNSISDNNFIERVIAVDRTYTSDFFHLIASHKRYEKISADTITEGLEKGLFQITNLLDHKKLTSYYAQTICEWFEKHPSQAAEIILDIREATNDRSEWFLPEILSSDLIESVMQAYIYDPDANPNYLELIGKSAHLRLSNELKLAASKKHQIAIDKLFENGAGIQQEIGIDFNKNQEEYIEFHGTGMDIRITYGRPFFEERDYLVILSNFIHGFRFVDKNGRIALVSLDSELGILEKHLFSRSKKDYSALSAFQGKDGLSLLQINGYYNLLAENGLQLEDIIEWFFCEYLKKEFGIEDFTIIMPRSDLNYREKCILILPQMDSILKQISQLTSRGNIDLELLYAYSDHIVFGEIPSINDMKYFYAEEALSAVLFNFFSDQSPLHHIISLDEPACFYDAVTEKKVQYMELEEYERRPVDYFIGEEYLEIDDTGAVKFSNPIKVLILKELFYNECINLYRLPEEIKGELLRMKESGLVRSEGTFISAAERDYFNYFLNRSEYVNGPDLRNKYLHLGQTSPNDTEEIHFGNYMRLLRLMVLIVLKLHDDLCANEEPNEQGELQVKA